MRGLIICHSSALETLGGGERSVIALAERWRESYPDWSLTFVVPMAEGLMKPELEARGFDVEVIHSYPWLLRVPASTPEAILRYQRANAVAVEKLAEVISSRGIDLVMTNTIVSPWGAVAAAVTRVPHIWFVREYGDLDHGLSFQFGRERSLADVATLSNLVVSNSHAVEAHVAASAPDVRSAVLYPSVGVPAREQSRPARQDSPLRILSLGKISASKGQSLVIEAVATLRAAGRPVTATLVGTENPVGYADELRRLAEDRGIQDSISILDAVPDVLELLDTHDVGVTASSMEAFGRVTLEYMLRGLPVVGARSGGTIELVEDGVTGFLVEPNSADALAIAIAAYAADPDLVDHHGEAGWRRASLVVEGPESLSLVLPRLVEIGSQPSFAGLPTFLIDQMSSNSIPHEAVKKAAAAPVSVMPPQSAAPAGAVDVPDPARSAASRSISVKIPGASARRAVEANARERAIQEVVAVGLVRRGYVDLDFYNRVSGRTFSSVWSAARHFASRGAYEGFAPSSRLEPEWAAASTGLPIRRVVTSLAINGERAFGSGAPTFATSSRSTLLSPDPTTDPAFLSGGFGARAESTMTMVEAFGETVEPEFEEHPEVGAQLSGVDWAAQRSGSDDRDPGLVSVLMATYRDWKLTVLAVKAVLEHSGSNRVEVVVVDNGSSAPVRRILRSAFSAFGNVTVINLPQNINFAAGNNLAFEASSGSRVVFLNNDTTVRSGWLDPLLEELDRPDVRGVQPILLYPDGLIQAAGTVFGGADVLPWHFLAFHNEGDVQDRLQADFRGFTAVTAACLAVSADEFSNVSGFDEIYTNGMEDVDLCFRLTDTFGGSFSVVPSSVVTHYESISSGRGLRTTHNRRRYFERWGGRPIGSDAGRYQDLGLELAGFAARDAKRGQTGLLWGVNPIVVRSTTESRPRRISVRLPYVDRAGSTSESHLVAAEEIAAALRGDGATVLIDPPTLRYRSTRHLDDLLIHFASDKHQNLQPGSVNVIVQDAPDAEGQKFSDFAALRVEVESFPRGPWEDVAARITELLADLPKTNPAFRVAEHSHEV